MCTFKKFIKLYVVLMKIYKKTKKIVDLPTTVFTLNRV